MNIKNDITVIMRSVGERTENLCRHIIASEIGDNNIHLIRNLPLHESTEAVCTHAVSASRKYTIMIGADYIPRRGWIQDMYDMAEVMTGDWLFVKGTIIDKFLMELRGDIGGPMLYPTHILEQWLDLLPTIENRMTTEASCQRHFKQQGYQVFRGKTWLALHDYEQHYRDIYRSMFIGGKKHKAWRNILLPRWYNMADNDRDYEVAAYAHHAGHIYEGTPQADFRNDYGWSESPFVTWQKEPITSMEYDVMQYEPLQYLNQ